MKKQEADFPGNAEDLGFKKAVAELTEAIVEDLRDGYKSELDPFEIYEKRVRQQVFSNLHTFRERFMKGYRVMLNELEKEQATQSQGGFDGNRGYRGL